MKNKTNSPLVESVLSLDGHLADLSRLGAKIEALEMQSDFDFEQAQKHIELFAQSGEKVSAEIATMAQALNDARNNAETIALMVAGKAELLQARKASVQAKMEELRDLGESVKEVSRSLAGLQRPGADVSPEERAQWSMRLAQVELQIRPLIEKAKSLRKDAQEARMKVLEQSADSLTQSLTAISIKITASQPQDQVSH
jgi:prophage DNA circulation protein